MQRTRSWRRAQRQRIIDKRLNIAQNVWRYTPESWPWIKNGARFAKYNFTCDSRMCKLDTMYSKKEKRRIEWVKNPIEMPS